MNNPKKIPVPDKAGRSIWAELPPLFWISVVFGSLAGIVVVLSALGVQEYLPGFKKFDQENFIAEGMSLFIEVTLLGSFFGYFFPRIIEKSRLKQETARWQPMAEYLEGHLVDEAKRTLHLHVIDGTKGRGWYFSEEWAHRSGHHFGDEGDLSRFEEVLSERIFGLVSLTKVDCGPSTSVFRRRVLKLTDSLSSLNECLEALAIKRRERFLSEWELQGLLENKWRGSDKRSILIAEIYAELCLHPHHPPATSRSEIEQFYEDARVSFDPDGWESRSVTYLEALNRLFLCYREVLQTILNDFRSELEDFEISTIRSVLDADFSRGNILLQPKDYPSGALIEQSPQIGVGFPMTDVHRR